jgi:hypothetical protein
MSEHPPTLLIVSLRPVHEEETCYHVDEALTTAGITYRLIRQQVERISLEGAAPFVITHFEKRLIFALHAPLAPRAIEKLALLVTTGLILGFAVKGEIVLGSEEGVINNLVE